MPQKDGRDFRILLVDDDPMFRDLLSFSLKRSGFQVALAQNGKEALDLIHKEQVDAVITDIRMPGGSGIELLDRLKESHPNLPVVLFMTGFDDISILEVQKKGAEGIFSKPLDPRFLEDTISQLLVPEGLHVEALDSINSKIDLDLQFPGSDWIKASGVRLAKNRMFAAISEEFLPIFPNVNDVISFKIDLENDGKVFEGGGVVRFVRTKDMPNLPVGCGIDFSRVGDTEKKRIEFWLQDHSGKRNVT